MLVLSRKQNDKIIIGDTITLMVVSIQGDKVRLGIEAPRDVSIHREEVYQAIQHFNNAANNNSANPQQIVDMTAQQPRKIDRPAPGADLG